MTDAQKLEALIQRAIEGKYYNPAFMDVDDKLLPKTFAYTIEQEGYYGLIFNHKFAKALFGEIDNQNANLSCYSAHRAYDEPEIICYWQFHLQQAVISDNPIDYMYQAVFGDAVVK